MSEPNKSQKFSPSKVLLYMTAKFKGGKLSWLQDETPFTGKVSWSGVLLTISLCTEIQPRLVFVNFRYKSFVN